MHVAACKEFYANLTVSISEKKEVARSCVRGVKIELDGMILAGILGVPGNNGICEYIKDIWEEGKYCKPLEITKKFANDELITVARRVKSTEMKPFQRFLHFIVMKNIAPSFGKRDTTSFMDLTYMDHLLSRRLVNLPRVMLRHISNAISIENHELPYGDWLTMVFEAFDVPLIDKKGEEPKRRRRDDDVVPAENVGNVEVNKGEEAQQDFDLEAVIDEVEIQREEMEKEGEIQGESRSTEKFYDVEVGVEEPADEVPVVLAFPASPKDSSNVQHRQDAVGVDPSVSVGNIPDSDFLKLQAELDRALIAKLQAKLYQARAESARLLALLQQATPKPKP
ncbi:hypothetical protein Dimus_013721 [Dionaea muscipula]